MLSSKTEKSIDSYESIEEMLIAIVILVIPPKESLTEAINIDGIISFVFGFIWLAGRIVSKILESVKMLR